ncbi:hypothetical protein HAD_01795 [Hyphomonas adhaerens MHS-3]|uniref:Uncharacterized protein n=1 Tax=Hyphomonas adhaerens MHS-3 TaxID=1280949 RepID=A0A069E372_9PROT|nr:hypothetical protein [Hyphomonas adhaerens]KCZ84372.1 hypothetical protein HAD_01795 [Hyphomonas adhaerens MHS-3]
MATDNIWQMLTDNVGTVVTVVSAIAAVIGALASRAETRKQRQLRTEQLRQTIDSSSLDWGNAAIDTLARAAMLARTRHFHGNEGSFQTAKAATLVNLTGLIDRGRMFFPNLDEHKKGTEKDGAYRGSRPPILDAMVWVHCETAALTREGGPTGDNSGAFIDDCRRLVVSELQAHLDPRRLNQVVGRYDGQTRTHQQQAIERADSLRQQLLTRRPGVAIDNPTRQPEQPETVQ